MSEELLGVCTECPERCMLTTHHKDCLKIGDKIWLHRDQSVCRQCSEILQSCPVCTREPVIHTEVGKQTPYQEISEMLWNNYRARHPNWKNF